MHFNTKIAYQRLFPQIDLEQEELSNSDMIMIANYFYKNINFNSEKIKSFLFGLDRSFKPTQYYKKKLATFLNPSNTAGGSEVSIDYWINRGWSEFEAKEKISNLQRKKSILCEEYWISKGMSSDEARSNISEIQKNNANKSNSVFNPDYWASKGYSDDEANVFIEENKRKRSSWNIGFWVNKGFTEKEARGIIKKNAQNMTLENLIERHGIQKGTEIKNSIERKRHKFGTGKNNPQYGKSSPKGSGASVSGTYKDYYFRSLLEYFVIKYFENNNIAFVCNDVSIDSYPNKVIIPYVTNAGVHRKYTPDFIVNDVEVWEVKNVYALGTEEVQTKISYARDFINNSDKLQTLKIITERDIEMNMECLLDDVISGLVKIDTGKVQRFYKRIGKINESYIKEKIGHIAESV
jgi:hypothetical protein